MALVVVILISPTEPNLCVVTVYWNIGYRKTEINIDFVLWRKVFFV